MAVWTEVSLDEVNSWLQSRNLTEATIIAPVDEGVEDTIYKLSLADGTFACLRLFERTESNGPLTIAARLAQSGLPTCPPIEDLNGHIQAPLNGKAAALFPWIDGISVAQPKLEQIYSIGVFMGRMVQESLPNQDWYRDDPRGWDWFNETASKLMSVLPLDQRNELEVEIDTQVAFWKQNEMLIPHGAIHGDLFRNNVLFDQTGKLAAVLDWGFSASNRPLAYDLAIVANDWCLQDGTSKLDTARLDALLRGRESIMSMTEAEKAAWPMALRLAAMRFYLSRALDFHFPRDPDGKTLDPSHFHNILRVHIQQSELTSQRPTSAANQNLPLLPTATL